VEKYNVFLIGNKSVGILIFSAADMIFEKSSSGTLEVKILESKAIL
jgi:hypothetical protein